MGFRGVQFDVAGVMQAVMTTAREAGLTANLKRNFVEAPDVLIRVDGGGSTVSLFYSRVQKGPTTGYQLWVVESGSDGQSAMFALEPHFQTGRDIEAALRHEMLSVLQQRFPGTDLMRTRLALVS